MNIISTDIHIIKNIGDINETKVSKLQEVFGEEFSIDTINSKVIIMKGENQIINISAKSIIYRILGDSTIEGLVSITKLIKSILESLMVEFDGSSVLDITAEQEIDENVFEDSLKKIRTDNFKTENIKGLKGIGLRMISETEKYSQDLKKEPSLSESNSYFYRLTRFYNKEKITLEELISDLENIYVNKENEFIEG